MAELLKLSYGRKIKLKVNKTNIDYTSQSLIIYMNCQQKWKTKQKTQRGKGKQKISVTREEKEFDEWVYISLDLEQNLAGNPTRIIPILSISHGRVTGEGCYTKNFAGGEFYKRIIELLILLLQFNSDT